MTHENAFLGVKLVYPSSWFILDFADRDSCKPETILFPCSATGYLKIPDALNIGNPRLLISRDVMGQQDCKCDNLTDYLRYKHQAITENAEENTSTSDFHFTHWEMEHPYVDTDLKTKNIVTRGWPVCIFCSARDESRWDIWPEIQSRFIIISPNMSKQKYTEANILTFEKLGLPDFVQDQIIVSKKEMEIARKCILLLRKRIKRLCSLPDNFDGLNHKHNNSVWIPYFEYLAKSLPATRGIDMRSAKHIGSLLAVIAIAKSRFLLDDGEGKLSAIARSDDLVETLRIAQNLVRSDYSGIPVHKLGFYEEIFLEFYSSKKGPDEKDGKTESIKGVTTRELSDYYIKVKGKSISPDNLKKQFLEELKANDLIGEVKSEIDGRRLLYYPLAPPGPGEQHNKITKLSNEGKFDNISYIPTLDLSRDYKYIPENWLIFQILALANYRMNFDLAIDPFADFLNNSEELKFLETDITLDTGSSTRLSIRDFISKYESPSSISIRYIFKANFYGFYSKNIGFMREVCLLDDIQYGKLSNRTAFDNSVISDSSDRAEDPTATIEYPPKCYHCTTNSFTNKDQYERHMVNHHRDLPGYPGPPDLRKLGLIPQGLPWEQELPRDQYFEFESEPKK